MKERGKQDNALLCLIVAEIIYLIINVISLARSSTTSLTVLCLAGFPPGLVYRIYLILVNAVTCLLSYFCFGKIFRSRRIGMLGAFLYTCSAYRITNMYSRSALGEFSAMAFFPLLVYAAVLLVGDGREEKERSRAWIWLSLGVTGVCQTHMISLQMCFVCWIFFMILQCKQVFRREAWKQMLLAGVSTVILNLWFIVPFLQYYTGGDYQINSGMVERLGPSGLYLPAGFDQNILDHPQIFCEDGIEAEYAADSGKQGVMRLACVNSSGESGMVIAPLIYYPNYGAKDGTGYYMCGKRMCGSKYSAGICRYCQYPVSNSRFVESV